MYCIAHWDGGLNKAVGLFKAAVADKHADVVRKALDIVAKRFGDDDKTPGHQKDGCVAVARFEIPDADEGMREAQTLRQREVAALITEFIRLVSSG